MELKFSHCRISIDFGFPAMLALVFLQTDNNMFKNFLAACFLHELGHGIVMCLTGAGIDRIRFYAAGIQMYTNTCLLSFGQAFGIYWSGPLVNLLFAWLLHTPEAAALHLGMGIFNLLPYRVLDGGAALACILKPESLQILHIFCIFLSIGIFLILCAYHVQNPTLYLMIVYLAISEILVDKNGTLW